MIKLNSILKIRQKLVSTPLLKQYSSKTVPLTRERYSYLKRNPSYKALEDHDITHFKGILGETGILSNLKDSSELDPYNTDWYGVYKGSSNCILFPNSTQQVSDILKYCNDKKLAVVPQGGNTGLVGGSVPVFDEVILSTNKLNKVRSFDSVSGVIVADAGCILEQLNQYLEPEGYMMPLDLGAKGTCHIGGNLATNAGGLRLLRYGSLHGTTLGLEVVLPDGTILDNLSTLRKDNTGYDLKQLFIGSEGTLGIITAASILTPKTPKSVNVALLAVNSFEDVQKIYKLAKNELLEILSAIEFMDSSSFTTTLSYLNQPKPLSESHPFYVLIETQGSNFDHDQEKLAVSLEKLLDSGLAKDGLIAQDEAQSQKIWNIRESIQMATQHLGKCYSYDVSIPLPHFYEAVELIKNILSKSGYYKELDPNNSAIQLVCGYGHLGDCNLHLNIVSKETSDQITSLLEPFIFEVVQKFNGSISAEHGLGFHKAKFIQYSKSDTMIELMKMLKLQFDPNQILNPYKYLPM